jgi:hypothetical protein
MISDGLYQMSSMFPLYSMKTEACLSSLESDYRGVEDSVSMVTGAQVMNG